jgi:hypothetical protein
MKKFLKETLIGIISILLFGIIVHYFNGKRVNKLVSQGKTEMAVVSEISTTPKGSKTFIYIFTLSDSKYSGKLMHSQVRNSKFRNFYNTPDSLIGYKFKVYYDPKDPENNYMDFNEFIGIDSTLWKHR